MLIATSCSSKKRVSVPGALCAARYRSGTSDAFGRVGVRHVRAASNPYAAACGAPSRTVVPSAARASVRLPLDLSCFPEAALLPGGEKAIPSYHRTDLSRIAPVRTRRGRPPPGDWSLAVANDHPICDQVHRFQRRAPLAQQARLVSARIQCRKQKTTVRRPW